MEGEPSELEMAIDEYASVRGRHVVSLQAIWRDLELNDDAQKHALRAIDDRAERVWISAVSQVKHGSNDCSRLCLPDFRLRL